MGLTRDCNMAHQAYLHEFGHFITLEGGEGAGKTTALEAIRKTIADRGHEVVLTREPGGSPLAEHLRASLLTAGDETVTPYTELLMMFAARSQHVEHLIRPALDRGAVVVSSRFTDSSYAYQGYGRKLSLELIESLETRVVGIAPGLTIYLDVPVAIGRERAMSRGEGADRIEREHDAFFQRVHAGYMARAKEHSHRVRVVDASRSIEQVTADIRAILNFHFDELDKRGGMVRTQGA